jgi:octaprenyl-diphosphate synthase
MPVPDKDKMLTEAPTGGSLAEHLEAIADGLSTVRECICEQLVTSDEGINAMLDHIGLRSGKMLRPALVLMVGEACGNVTETHVRIGAVVELLHAATLLHDDVLDEAVSRRRSFTANRLWGNEAAVLLGDFLLGKVFVMCSRIEPREVSQMLSDTAVEICRGELSQNIQRGNFDLTESEYFDIVRGKTAVLFETCGYLGSLAAGGDLKRNELFGEFGLKIGMAFQVTDDLLDIVGDEATVGKTLGTDLAGRKMTLPMIHMLGAAGSDKGALIEILSGKIDAARLRGMLDESGSLEYTRSVGRRFCNEAVECLSSMKESARVDRLIEIATSVAARYI